MSAVISPSETDCSAPLMPATRPLPRFVRANGALRMRFAAMPRGTEAVELRESGGFRVRFPRVGSCEAVLINTGGGMTGGDRLAVGLVLDSGASATLTTQSAEKVYRSDGPDTQVRVRASVGPGAGLRWLPQETILFSGARLDRSLDVDLAPGAELLLAETLVFGRLAMGETLGTGSMRDRWRIRRGGCLVFAETVSLSGDLGALLARPATGGGARAVATIVHVCDDAAGCLEALREVLANDGTDAGASAWNGMLVARLADDDPARLRAALSRALGRLMPGPLPRVWQS